MHPMAGTPAQHIAPPARLWLAVVLISLLLSLAACSGEEATQPGDGTATTETTAVTQGAIELDPPAQIATAEPVATQASPSAPMETTTAAMPSSPVSILTPSPAPEPTAAPTAAPAPTLAPTPIPTPAPAPTPMPAPVPTALPTLIPSPAATQPSPPTVTPPPPTATPTPVTATVSLAEYSPLLAEAMSSLPPDYDFVSDGLSHDETMVLDWADSRLFSNPNFLQSKWGPDNWPSELTTASAQALVLMMREINIQTRANGEHVVSWEKDSLDIILDHLEVYPGLCVYCYGKSGYEGDGIDDNYIPVIRSDHHVHREMLKTFAYFARADGEGLLVRSFMDNDPDDFELLYKRKLDKYPITIGVGSFAYENVSFMSQILLPDGTLESYPSMVFRMTGDARTEREAAERIFDYTRKNLTHDTGDNDEIAKLFRPYTVTPYAPELGWVLYVGEAGSPSSSALLTGAFRVVGLKAEQFQSPRKIRRAGSVEVGGETYYYNGNAVLGQESATAPLCNFFQTLEEVEERVYCRG